ncbi:hypothetical protein BH11ACT8_BH11ACT8_22860 [soil metagenome]
MARWVGPPPLLIAATVLGVLVAPQVSQADEPHRPVGVAQHGQANPLGEQLAGSRLGDGARVPAGTTGRPSSTPTSTPTADKPKVAKPVVKKPSAKKPGKSGSIAPRLLGVATFNEYRALSVADARADALSVTSRKGVSIVGWQEGMDDGPVYAMLAQHGWATKRDTSRRGARELAVSWRRSRFELVGSALHRLARGVGQGEGQFPFGDRYALRVTLRDRASGQLVSVINTHLPQAVEDLDHPGHWQATKNSARAHRQLDRLTEIWDRAPGRWVIGTGDYNVDARADLAAGSARGVAGTFSGVATSSYSLLGFGDLAPTHPVTGRYIDYVHVADSDLDRGRVTVLGHRTVNGLNSDHRPLLAWLRLT